MNKLITMFTFLLIYVGSINAQWNVLSTVSQNYPSNFIVNHNGDLYATTNDGVYKSTNDGNNWTEITNSFIVDASNANRYIEFAGSNIYIGTTRQGVYMSPDNGVTWQFDTTGLGSFGSGPEIDLLYSEGTNVFTSFNGFSSSGFFRKTAGTGAWSKVVSGSLGTSFGTEVLGLTKIGAELFAATPSEGIFFSTDDGVTWTQKANNNFPANATIFAFKSNSLISKGNTLYYKSHDGLFASDDFGDNWTRIDQGFAGSSIQCIYTDGANIYASLWGNDNAYYSTDGGNSWIDISAGLPQWVVSFAMKNGALNATTFGNPEVIVNNGITDVEPVNNSIPSDFSLSQNYPNPFNPSTKIKFSVPQTSYVSLRIYDMLGNEITTLVNEELAQGEYNVDFIASDLSSGVYFYQLRTNEFNEIKKMVLLR